MPLHVNLFKTGLAEHCLSSGQTSLRLFIRVAVPQATLNTYFPSYRLFDHSFNKNHLTVLAARNSEEHVPSLAASRMHPHSYLPSYTKFICWLWKFNYVPDHRHLPLSCTLVFHPIGFSEITSACASICTKIFVEVESNLHLASIFFSCIMVSEPYGKVIMAISTTAEMESP